MIVYSRDTSVESLSRIQMSNCMRSQIIQVKSWRSNYTSGKIQFDPSRVAQQFHKENRKYAQSWNCEVKSKWIGKRKCICTSVRRRWAFMRCQHTDARREAKIHTCKIVQIEMRQIGQLEKYHMSSAGKITSMTGASNTFAWIYYKSRTRHKQTGFLYNTEIN